MPFDISKVLSIDRKIAATSPAGFFVHFIGSGFRELPCGSAALPADSLLRHRRPRPTIALPPSALGALNGRGRGGGRRGVITPSPGDRQRPTHTQNGRQRTTLFFGTLAGDQILL